MEADVCAVAACTEEEKDVECIVGTGVDTGVETEVVAGVATVAAEVLVAGIAGTGVDRERWLLKPELKDVWWVGGAGCEATRVAGMVEGGVNAEVNARLGVVVVVAA